jgi:hypothetical protein
MKSAGANCLEIHQIALSELMPKFDKPNEAFIEGWVDTWVNWCTKHEMYCVLNIGTMAAWEDWAVYLSMPSWLWDGLYATPSPKDKSAYDAIIRDIFNLNVAKQNKNRAAFANLWKNIANRYKDNPYIIFSIMNEPFWNVEIPDEATSIHLGKSYSAFMEQVVDAIRSTGATQRIFIDLPFLWDKDWKLTVQSVNRENIVWEGHAYGNVWEPDNKNFKNIIDSFVQLFVNDFKKPLLIGEYGYGRIDSVRENGESTWKSTLEGEVAYLNAQPLLGRFFVGWDYMHGEFASAEGSSNLNNEESEWIMQTVLTN